MMNIQLTIKGEGKKIKTTSLPAIIEGIVNEVAAETGLTVACISNIVSSQFKLVDETIRNNNITNDFDTYKSVRLQYLGTWKPSLTKFKKYRRILKIEDNV